MVSSIVVKTNSNPLKGSPEYVEKTFNCERNKLKTLDGAPQKVDGAFHCEHNELVSDKLSTVIGDKVYSDFNKGEAIDLE